MTKRRIKKLKSVVTILCAITMLLTSVTVYNAHTTNASISAIGNGKVYTVKDGINQEFTGFACNVMEVFSETEGCIGFAWGVKVEVDSIKVLINNAEVATYNAHANGVFVNYFEFKGLADGEYAIVVSAKTFGESSKNVTGNVTLEIENLSETEPAITNPCAVKWDTIAWLRNGTTDQANFERFKAYISPVNSKKLEVINIQSKEGVNALYMPNNDSPADKIEVNGADATDYCITDGAQTFVPVLILAKKYNTVEITTINGNSLSVFIFNKIEEDNLPDMSDMLTYEQYQAEYYSDNAELITGAYMTYSEIEDNYEPTTYALNNMLSFGWKARFGFSDSAQIWETMLLDILFKTGAGSPSITAWEKNSVKLSEDLCKYISKNNLADVDKSISSDYKENLKKIINKTNETKGFYDESTTVGDIVNTLADSAKTVKEAMEIYAKYVELRKMLDSDIVAFLKQLKGTQNYKNIPAFQRAVDKVTANINVDSKKLLSLIIQEKGVDSVVKKAVNWVVGSAVEVILGEKILKLADITKATTIHLMNTICGTDELTQSNIYLYMLNRIDEAATEAFKNASGICLTSGGKQCYQVVNGGLQFITNLYYQGIAVCRKWSRTISTDILTRIETGPYVSVKRPHYDMATAYFNLNRKSSTEEKMQYIEDKCSKDEEYVNVVLENQPAFARIQWYKDLGISEQENSCLAIFKVENPNGRYSLYAQVVPKNTVVKFPGLSVKNGYKIPSEWYVDENYTQSVGSMPVITDDTTYYARYTKNILFETDNEGAKIISLNGTAQPKAKSLMKSFNTTDVTLQKEKYEIPAYIDGYKVVELGDDIFDEMSGIKEVFIPATVKKISDKAFKSLMEDTTYRYVEGSVAEEYLKNKEYQSIIAEEELILKESVVMLKAGENKQLQLERKGSCVAEEILWQSSNNDIVKVENGKVYGLKEGIAIVMATVGSVTVRCEVRVKGNIVTSSETTTASGNENKIIKKPTSTKLKKIQSKKRSVKIVWKKTKKVNGYQIQYSTSRKLKKAKKITIKNAKITSKTLKKLKVKKKYYVRIRTYIVVNGKKYYSDWSKTKVKRTN